MQGGASALQLHPGRAMQRWCIRRHLIPRKDEHNASKIPRHGLRGQVCRVLFPRMALTWRPRSQGSCAVVKVETRKHEEQVRTRALWSTATQDSRPATMRAFSACNSSGVVSVRPAHMMTVNVFHSFTCVPALAHPRPTPNNKVSVGSQIPHRRKID